ncbi:MAG: hypothetical protein Q9226_008857 [Calogaya cf. arnoldii]
MRVLKESFRKPQIPQIANPETLDNGPHIYWRHLLDNDADLQTEFVNAFSSQNWQEVRELLTKNPDLDVNCADENGERAVHLASKVEGDDLSFLPERGADPDLISPREYTAFVKPLRTAFPRT